MVLKRLKIYSFFILINVLSNNIILSKILFVYEHTRNGVRSPGYTEGDITTNFHKDSFGVFWNKKGEITKIGLRSQYLLGVKDRKKYQNLLSQDIDEKEIFVGSTQFKRTIMSAQAQLFGMYPLYSNTKLLTENERNASFPPGYSSEDIHQTAELLQNYSLPFGMQIMPVLGFSPKQLNQLLTTKEFCNKLNDIKEGLRNGPNFKKILLQLNSTYGKGLLKYFNIKDDSNINYLFDYNRAKRLADEYICDYKNNKDLSILKVNLGIDIDELYKLFVELRSVYLFEEKCNEFISRFAVSEHMREIITFMNKRIEVAKKNQSDLKVKNYFEPKYVLISGHDTSVSPLILFMKYVFGTKLIYPHYSTGFYLELHNNESITDFNDINKFYIEYYINDELQLRTNFINFKRKVLRSLFSKNQIKSYCFSKISKLQYFIIFFLIIIVGILNFFLINLRNKKQKNISNECKKNELRKLMRRTSISENKI